MRWCCNREAASVYHRNDVLKMPEFHNAPCLFGMSADIESLYPKPRMLRIFLDFLIVDAIIIRIADVRLGEVDVGLPGHG
jgi:hypothetical protein